MLFLSLLLVFPYDVIIFKVSFMYYDKVEENPEPCSWRHFQEELKSLTGSCQLSSKKLEFWKQKTYQNTRGQDRVCGERLKMNHCNFFKEMKLA